MHAAFKMININSKSLSILDKKLFLALLPPRLCSGTLLHLMIIARATGIKPYLMLMIGFCTSTV